MVVRLNPTVLMLDKRENRRDYITEQCQLHFGETPTFLRVGNGELYPRETYYYVNETASQVRNYNATIKKWIRQLKEKEVSQCLWLEDDILFLPNFADIFPSIKLTLPDSWDMVLLGMEPKAKLQIVSKHLVRVRKAYCLHAAIIRDTMYDVILSSPDSEALDVFLGERYFMWKVYAASPTIISQCGGFSEYAGINVPEKSCSYEGYL